MRDCLPCRLSAGQRHTAAVEPDRVYFKSVWYDRKTRAIRDGLSSSRNWPLRGLKYYNEMMQARLPAFCSRWPQTRLLLCGASLSFGEALSSRTFDPRIAVHNGGLDGILVVKVMAVNPRSSRN